LIESTQEKLGRSPRNRKMSGINGEPSWVRTSDLLIKSPAQ
jgi:hypothetical protein